MYEGRGLTKRYGRVTALDDVSFRLEPGKTLGVIGESGAGKSTLVRLALGLLKPDAGEILFDGKPIPPRGRGRLEFCRRVQAVFQDPSTSLDPRMRVGATLREPFRIHRIHGRARTEESIRTALAEVGLSEMILDRLPRELSGGECQRVAIARATLLEPRMLVCDEPVSSLDPILRAGILNIFLRLQKERGMSLLFISHDLGVIRHMSDDVIVLKEGRVCEAGARDSLFASPQADYTRRLIARLGPLAKPHTGDL